MKKATDLDSGVMDPGLMTHYLSRDPPPGFLLTWRKAAFHHWLLRSL